MSLGSATPNNQATVFEVHFGHATNEGVPIGAVLITMGDGNATIEDVQEVAQNFVDLINGSADFILGSATMSFPSLATMTATP